MMMTEAIVPYIMNGLRLPSGCLHLSDKVPNNGSRKRASTLSMAIITPENVSFRWKVFVRRSGTILLYICQNALIAKNANPTLIVCPTLSFTAFPSSPVSFSKNQSPNSCFPIVPQYLTGGNSSGIFSIGLRSGTGCENNPAMIYTMCILSRGLSLQKERSGYDLQRFRISLIQLTVRTSIIIFP